MTIEAGSAVKVRCSGYINGKDRRGWYAATVVRVYEHANLGTRIDVHSKTLGALNCCDPGCVRAR